MEYLQKDTLPYCFLVHLQKDTRQKFSLKMKTLLLLEYRFCKWFHCTLETPAWSRSVRVT